MPGAGSKIGTLRCVCFEDHADQECGLRGPAPCGDCGQWRYQKRLRDKETGNEGIFQGSTTGDGAV
jgi:hypothetical protein